MCGINGIIYFNGQAVETESLNRMGRLMAHRTR